MAYIYASSNVTGDPETPPAATGDPETPGDQIKPPTVAESQEVDEPEAESDAS
jgi:hypothetical protein